MLEKTITYIRMIKLSHSIFAVPFAIMAAFLAGDGHAPGFFGWGKLILIILAMVTARCVAMTYNRIADADIDAANPRTANRAIPTGKLTKKHAYIFLFINAFIFACSTILFWRPIGPYFGFQNPWPAILTIPVLIFICFYSHTKRFTWASHFFLGASLMCAPLGAWIAISPPQGPIISLEVCLLGLAVLLWTAGFDIIYACQDIDIDRREGLFSIPAALGLPTAMWFSRMCHSSCVTMLFLVAVIAELGMIYIASVAFVSLLLIIEHLLVRRGKMAHIKLAFGTINGFISIVLAIGTITDIITRK